MPLRILAVYGTRREGMKLAPVVEALRADADFEVKVCSTSRQGALAQDLADVFDLRPDWDLDLWHEGDDLYRAVAGVIEGLRDVLREARPDWVIIQGDTTSAFASALGAFYAGAKIAHVGGGLRTGDMANPFPEEGHRTMATRLASLHLAATAHARAALKAEGIHPGKVEVTGSPIVDTLRKALALEAPLDADLAAWTEGRKLAVLTVRRSDRLGEGAAGVVEAIRVLHDRDAALRWALVLRRDHAPSDILRAQLQGLERVRFLDRMPYPVFLTLLKRASILLTDAGGILEEAPSLGIPVVLLADKTSRVEALEGGWAELAGTDPKRIQQAFDAYRRRWLAPRAPSPYGDGHAAARIVAALRRKIGLR